jgi:hypothetical protein
VAADSCFFVRIPGGLRLFPGGSASERHLRKSGADHCRFALIRAGRMHPASAVADSHKLTILIPETLRCETLPCGRSR